MYRKLTVAITPLLFIGLLFTGQVEASSNFKLELYTVDTELEQEKQEHVKGTKKQLEKVNKKTMKFVKDIAFDAHISGNEYGIYPSVIIAQAVLESSNGESGLSADPYNNLFGIKGFYNGNSVQMKTKEDNGSGKMYVIYANFKKYPNKGASLEDHSKLLREGLNGFYSGTWRENAKTPKDATDYLQGRYATDTKYSSKLMTIINNHNLERFDSPLTDRDLAWLSSDSLDPYELPIVEDYKTEDIQTWGSGLKDIEKQEQIDVAEDIGNYNKYYVSTHLGLEEDLASEEIPRFKRNPENGDIAIYKVENGDNELIERYAIVEGSRIDSMLISEAVKGNSELHVIYRTVPRDYLYKYEFISTEKLAGHKSTTIDIIESDELVD